MRLNIGPVVMKDEIAYFKEVMLLEEITVTLGVAGLSADGKLAARVTSTGGWLDLAARKLIAPPANLLATWQALGKTENFQELATSIK